MITINYVQLESNINSYLDKVANDCGTIIVKRKNNKNVVILSEEVYNSLLENAYIRSSKDNYDWLMESKKQIEEGKGMIKTLKED